MESDETHQPYVLLLREWAYAAENDPGPKRALMDPELDLRNWVCLLVEKYYVRSLDRSYGWQLADFTHDCFLKLLIWVKQNRERLLEPDFTPRRLAALVRKIAQNHAISLKRKQQDRYYEECSGFFEETEMPEKHIVPPPLQWKPDFSIFDAYPKSEKLFRRAREEVKAFARSICNMRKMLQTHVALLCYCHRLGMAVGLPRHWLLYDLLCTRRSHLPEELRDFLKSRFLEVPYNVINSRVGVLKRAFGKFLEERAKGSMGR
jgi:hypothetical protein